ncbi:hypothetical protein B0H14DRAFT_2594849 [Mycena olivaceomarginata]|nr:hypothetical protein B0H14DRAFT_2594849 [Mycena olivaceomarginata]
MATFRTTSIAADKRAAPSKRQSIASSIYSFSSSSSISISSIRRDSIDTYTYSPCTGSRRPIFVTTTVCTTTATYPMTVPPPFTASLGSDERLPRPRRGAPAVPTAAEFGSRKQRKEEKARKDCGRVLDTMRRAIGLKRTHLDPALCEGWWCVPVFSSLNVGADWIHRDFHPERITECCDILS